MTFDGVYVRVIRVVRGGQYNIQAVLMFATTLKLKEGAVQRRSAIEIHPKNSEAPTLRSSIHLTRKLTSAKIKLHRGEISRGPRLQNLFFSKSRLAIRRFRAKEPRLSETK